MSGYQVFIGGIPPRFASAGYVLEAIRTKTGLEAIACDVKQPKIGGKPWFAYVTFKEEAEARICIGYNELIQLDGRKLRVNEAHNQHTNGTQRVEVQRVRVEKSANSNWEP
jgi:hypothetical protein